MSGQHLKLLYQRRGNIYLMESGIRVFMIGLNVKLVNQTNKAYWIVLGKLVLILGKDYFVCYYFY